MNFYFYTEFFLISFSGSAASSRKWQHLDSNKATSWCMCMLHVQSCPTSAIVDKLQPLAARVKTLTFDNGKEFAGHAYIDEQLQSTAYFARPFTSWERGSNENLNGLLRQYVPKKRAMSTVSDEEIRIIQKRLINRPRKRLGFKTPAEVFQQSLKRVALQTWICLSFKNVKT